MRREPRVIVDEVEYVVRRCPDECALLEVDVQGSLAAQCAGSQRQSARAGESSAPDSYGAGAGAGGSGSGRPNPVLACGATTLI